MREVFKFDVLLAYANGL